MKKKPSECYGELSQKIKKLSQFQLRKSSDRRGMKLICENRNDGNKKFNKLTLTFLEIDSFSTPGYKDVMDDEFTDKYHENMLHTTKLSQKEHTSPF